MNRDRLDTLPDLDPAIACRDRRVIIWDRSRFGDEAPAADLFDPAAWAALDRAAGRAAGRGEASFVVADDGMRWVLRHYRRGGLIAHVNHDCYLWAGAMRTRPVQEFHLLSALHRRGFSVPRPVAAQAVRGTGGYYRADLITQAIPEAQTLADRLAGQCLSAVDWSRLGQSIASLHQVGIWHADLNARNVLINAEGRFYLIDFDRARFRGDGAWRAANLKRFRRSLDKFAKQWPQFGFAEADWQALREGYREAWGRW